MLCAHHSPLTYMDVITADIPPPVGESELRSVRSEVVYCHQKLQSYSMIQGISSTDFHRTCPSSDCKYTRYLFF